MYYMYLNLRLRETITCLLGFSTKYLEVGNGFSKYGSMDKKNRKLDNRTNPQASQKFKKEKRV